MRDDPVLLDALGATADPDLALLGLVRLVEAQDGRSARHELLDTLISGQAAARPAARGARRLRGARRPPGPAPARLAGPRHVRAADLHPGVAEFERGLAEATDPVSLRVAYRRCLLSIAARDVCGTTDLAETAAELADLATATLRAALAIAQAAAPDDAALCRLAVVAMGKCGGHELNYVSDVDVIFVGEAVDGAEEGKALQAATRLASHLMRICSETTVEGTIWPVDANLRPEGRNGPLVRTLSSHLAYYQRWAKTWEFQALLKARPVAGDVELGEAYVDAVAPLVWQAAERENFVADVQKMRRRVVDNIPAAEVERELKLGPGRAAGRRVRRAAAPVGARPRRHHAAQRHHPGRPAARSPPAATSGARTPRSSTTRTASCAPWSTASSSTGCGAPTWCPRTRPTCAGSAAPSGCAPTRSPS